MTNLENDIPERRLSATHATNTPVALTPKFLVTNEFAPSESANSTSYASMNTFSARNLGAVVFTERNPKYAAANQPPSSSQELNMYNPHYRIKQLQVKDPKDET